MRRICLGVAVLTAVSGLSMSALAQPSVLTLGGVGSPKLNGTGTRLVGTANEQAVVYSFSGGAMTITAHGGQAGVAISNDGLILAGNIQNLGINNTLPLTRSVAGRSSGGAWVDVPLFASPGMGTPFPPGILSSAYDMSPDGRYMTGMAYDAATSNNARAFHYDAVTNITTQLPALPPLFPEPDMSPARASAISDDGTVIAGFDQTTNRAPTVWTYDSGTSTWTETVLDVEGGEVACVSGNGQKLFGTRYVTATQATVWTRSGNTWVAADFPTPAAAPAGETGTLIRLEPSACSTDGSVVVGYALYGEPPFPWGTNHGWIWSQADGFRWLAEWLPTQGATGLSGVEFVFPLSISDNGRCIAGTGGFFGGGSWYVNLDGGFSSVPPVVMMQPTPTMTISVCDFFILNAAAAGAGPFSYQWYKNGQPLVNGTAAWGSEIFGADSSQLRIERQRPQDVGTYFCRITGGGGQWVDTANSVASLDNTAYPPPANDTCATATNIGESLVTQNICQAWVNEGDASCAANTKADVWFKYTPTFTGFARIDTCASNYDTVLTVYSDCGTTEIACNNDPEEGPFCSWYGTARINRLPVTTGTPVWIRVSTTEWSQPLGSLSLNVYQSPERPANDNCAGAQPAVVGLNFWDNTESTTDGAASCREESRNDVWFKFTPNSPSGRGKLTVSTCGFTDVNTVLSVLDSCGGTELACNGSADVDPCWSQSTISNLQLVSNNTVYIRVATGYSWASLGTGSVSLNYVNDPCSADISTSGNTDPQAGPDGFVTGDDFDLFINAFFNEIRRTSDNSLIADLTDGAGTGGPDGFLTGSDFDYFILRFFEGC